MRIEKNKIENIKITIKISVFYKYVYPVYILKGIFFSLLRYFLDKILYISNL